MGTNKRIVDYSLTHLLSIYALRSKQVFTSELKRQLIFFSSIKVFICFFSVCLIVRLFRFLFVCLFVQFSFVDVRSCNLRKFSVIFESVVRYLDSVVSAHFSLHARAVFR